MHEELSGVRIMAYTTIDDPSAYFNTLLYSGNASTNALTNSANAGNMQPDWLWLKCRNDAVSHQVFDTSRQTSGESTLVIRPNTTDAESNVSGDGMTSIDSNGFTLNGGGSGGGVNESGKTYVAWQWKANGGTTSTLSGGISATVQANTTSGFSIVKFTASGNNNQVEHGLGAVPHFIIAKGKDVSDNWFVYHKSIGANGYIMLNQTSATDSPNSTVWRNIDPTSQYFYVSTGGFNDDSTDVIAYCFAEKQGYSKFGSYTGNGNADGTFVYTGFKPAWLMVKRSSDAQGWIIWDSKRDTFNIADAPLTASESSGEDNKEVDLLSNGFKFRSADTATNAASTYIYMCFASSPLVGSDGTPCTAR